MYICNRCKNVFEEVKEIEGFHEEGFGYKLTVCPCCHSTDWDELNECNVCGRLIIEKGRRRKEVCFVCEKEIKTQIRMYYVEPISAKYGLTEDQALDALCTVLEDM